MSTSSAACHLPTMLRGGATVTFWTPSNSDRLTQEPLKPCFCTAEPQCTLFLKKCRAWSESVKMSQLLTQKRCASVPAFSPHGQVELQRRLEKKHVHCFKNCAALTKVLDELGCLCWACLPSECTCPCLTRRSVGAG